MLGESLGREGIFTDTTPTFPNTLAMKIYLTGDHAGFRLKKALAEHLPILGHDIVDMGPAELDPEDDYPDYVNPFAQVLANEPDALGLIFAGTGEGEAMAANRVKGVRAAVFYGKMSAVDALDAEGGHSQDGFDTVRLARRHNNANILSIGARFVSPEDADAAIRVFLDTPFDSSSARHERRLNKF
ncbi:MAG: ribose-5-phosphate isomerase [Parcubacteria group bacterium]|nr:ribose-5-phosphate isomerase [Parcubacteria group bacterium]